MYTLLIRDKIYTYVPTVPFDPTWTEKERWAVATLWCTSVATICIKESEAESIAMAAVFKRTLPGLRYPADMEKKIASLNCLQNKHHSSLQ